VLRDRSFICVHPCSLSLRVSGADGWFLNVSDSYLDSRLFYTHLVHATLPDYACSDLRISLIPMRCELDFCLL
jgi:hypothetical protein